MKAVLEKQIDEWLEKHKDMLTRDICELVRIKSVADKDNLIKPFGQGCRDVLDKFIEICGRHGLESENHEYYVAESYNPSWKNKKGRIGLMGHLDVVPEGKGWTYPPYDGVVKDGWIIGRGAQDNKGPCIAALYTLLCLRDLGIEMHHDIRVLAGTNEENGMDDAVYYANKCRIPDFTIVVDSPFPLCYGEKGIVEAWMISNDSFTNEVIHFAGGAVSNQIPSDAELVLQYHQCFEGILEKTDEACECRREGNNVKIQAKGIAGHIAFPDKTKNAISVLADFVLKRGLLLEKRDRDIMKFVLEASSYSNGDGVGIACNDEISGELVCGCGIVKMQEHKVQININARCPVTADGYEILDRMKTYISAKGFDLGKTRVLESNYYPKESQIIRNLSQTFQSVTGLKWEPQIFSAGTHARKIPNAVAYGPGCLNELTMPYEPFPDGHGGAHQPDEAQSIDSLCLAIKIYVFAVLRIDTLSIGNEKQRE